MAETAGELLAVDGDNEIVYTGTWEKKSNTQGQILLWDNDMESFCIEISVYLAVG